jgi:small subunit ribosomal protein S30e
VQRVFYFPFFLLLSSSFSFFPSSLCVTCTIGKVHGGLARAGKVKGQTPKVEKTVKRKKKTGRAKKRILYNRRFVNVVAGFGKKKGPNAQAVPI